MYKRQLLHVHVDGSGVLSLFTRLLLSLDVRVAPHCAVSYQRVVYAVSVPNHPFVTVISSMGFMFPPFLPN